MRTPTLMAVLNGDDGEAFQSLVARVCQWNFGAQAAYPRDFLRITGETQRCR